MKRNIAIALLLLIVIVETGYILTKKVITKTAQELAETKAIPTVTPRPALVFLTKGDNLLTSPMAKFVHKIDPNNLSDDAKKAIVGFAVTTQTQQNGTTVITLTPKDSDDQNQQYMLKAGQELYFIEMTPADDKKDADKDMNYRDDYGIITDNKGLIQ